MVNLDGTRCEWSLKIREYIKSSIPHYKPVKNSGGRCKPYSWACDWRAFKWCYVTRDGVTGDGDSRDDTFGDIGDGDVRDDGPFGTAASLWTSSEA